MYSSSDVTYILYSCVTLNNDKCMKAIHVSSWRGELNGIQDYDFIISRNYKASSEHTSKLFTFSGKYSNV